MKKEKTVTNSSVHRINTMNKYQLHRPLTNLSSLQEGTEHDGIKIFDNLPCKLTSLRWKRLNK
jgi:hypothetical protein